MKPNQFLKSLLGSTLIVAFTTLSSCSSDGTKKQSADDHAGHSHGENEETAKSESGNPQFQDEKAKAVYEHYIHVKTALVKSDAREAQAGAAQLQTAFTDAGNSKGADIAGKVASASKIEDQRVQFDVLTAEVENVVKASKLSSGKIFKQFCPMAKDGDGAYWLSSESEIRNPYYGDEMLECGEVKEEIK